MAWVDHGHAAVDDEIVGSLRQVAARLGAGPAERCGGNPLAGAVAVFERIRATDDLEPIRTLAAGHHDQLTERVRRTLAEPDGAPSSKRGSKPTLDV